MKAPAFWSDPDSAVARLLAPIGAFVGAATLARMARPGATAAIPVICIGNPTVGGAGKTPAARMVADHLASHGHRPAILLRGYGGRIEGPVEVDSARHTWSDVGDEALIHARRNKTIVARDRVAGAHLAEAQGASIIVMDDGFQNPALAKDMSILVIDAAFGLGNARVLPAGPLRAPFWPQAARADALMLIGEGSAGDRIATEAGSRGLNVLRARLVVEPAMREWLAGRDILAFCGIGRPAKFVETLGQAGARNAILRPFPDHHVYGEADAAALMDEARRTGLPLVTTEKDAVKLKGSPGLEALAAAAQVIPVRLVPDAGLGPLLARFSAPA